MRAVKRWLNIARHQGKSQRLLKPKAHLQGWKEHGLQEVHENINILLAWLRHCILIFYSFYSTIFIYILPLHVFRYLDTCLDICPGQCVRSEYPLLQISSAPTHQWLPSLLLRTRNQHTQHIFPAVATCTPVCSRNRTWSQSARFMHWNSLVGVHSMEGESCLRLCVGVFCVCVCVCWSNVVRWPQRTRLKNLEANKNQDSVSREFSRTPINVDNHLERALWTSYERSVLTVVGACFWVLGQCALRMHGPQPVILERLARHIYETSTTSVWHLAEYTTSFCVP